MTQPANPIFSPTSGSFIGAQTITITCPTIGASIYYRLDGGYPDTTSTPYTVPFLLPLSATINAIALKSGQYSNVSTAWYSIWIQPDRIDILQKKMFDVMPSYPTPITGPRLGRTRIYAAAVAGSPFMVITTPTGLPVPLPSLDSLNPGLEAQIAAAILQMREGGVMERVDLDGTPPDYVGPIEPATDWTPANAAYWIFQAVADPKGGANDVFLDQWGRMLQVPRLQEEPDNVYALRIIREVTMPYTTNIGMAELLDLMLGVSGTKVFEAIDYFGYPPRLNDGHRLNSGQRLAEIGIFNITDWGCTFTVLLPVNFDINGKIWNGSQSFTNQDVNNLVNRRKAAGTRKVATFTPSAVYPDQ